jgi:hypothetical protein
MDEDTADPALASELDGLRQWDRAWVKGKRTHSSHTATHGGLKDSIRFEDTTIRHVELPPGFTELPPGSIVLDSGITVTRMRFGGPDAGVAFAAPLDDVAPERIGPPVDFEQWWEPVILTDMQGNVFSRKSFVLALANEDGGAHVDPELRASYAALVKANSLGRMGAAPGQAMRPLLNIALTSTRQITHLAVEVRRRLDDPPTGLVSVYIPYRVLIAKDPLLGNLLGVLNRLIRGLGLHVANDVLPLMLRAVHIPIVA